jgi:DNA-binding transcriptional ArsR family regulator
MKEPPEQDADVRVDERGRRLITNVDTLKAMADPLRMRVLEVMMADDRKSWTAKDLAKTVGFPPTKLYYHLNLLEDRGLIKVHETRLVNGIVERHYVAGQRQISFYHGGTQDASDEGTAAMRDMVTSILEQVRDEIDLGLRTGAIYPTREAPDDKRMVVSRAVASVQLERLPEFRERLADLVESFSSEGPPTGQGHDFGLLVALHPYVGGATD